MKSMSRRQFVSLAALAGTTGLVSSLVGCSNSSPSSSSNSTTTSAPESSNTETMVGTISADGTERTFTDDAGRSVTIPVEINKVYCSIPTSEALVVALAAEKLVGWVNQPSELQLKYLPDFMADLPILGGWMGQKVTANMEAIIAAAPDVIVYCYGSSDADWNENDRKTYVDNADQISSDAGCPCIVVDGNLANTGDKYRWLGEILGVKERGEELASYVEDHLTAVADAVAKVPESEILTLYYAEGEGGLATDPAGSAHTQVVDFCNVKNVAVVDGFDGPAGQGLIEVSMESIIGWNPRVILVSGSTPANYETISTEPAWKDIQAVQDGTIYQTPTVPFGWFDRPPNVTRVLGCQWFANLMYPKYYKPDIREDIKEYFNLFYGATITDSEIDTIMGPNPKLP